jgi:hypothetical protein
MKELMGTLPVKISSSMPDFLCFLRFLRVSKVLIYQRSSAQISGKKLVFLVVAAERCSRDFVPSKRPSFNISFT